MTDPKALRYFGPQWEAYMRAADIAIDLGRRVTQLREDEDLLEAQIKVSEHDLSVKQNALNMCHAQLQALEPELEVAEAEAERLRRELPK